MSLVSNQYDVAPWFVTFSLIGAPSSTGPVIAEVGFPETAFAGPTRSNECSSAATNDDMPAANQDVGCFFLTDDGVNQAQAFGLLISYQVGVRQVGGVLLDVQPCCEEWVITAMDENMQPLDVEEVRWTDPDAGNGVATVWAFDLDTLPDPPSDDIRFIEFEYTGDYNHIVGLAFDSFSPSTLPPVQTTSESWGRIKAYYR